MGIIVGMVIGIILIAVAIFVFCRYIRRRVVYKPP